MRVGRRSRIGAGFRFAVLVVYPLMAMFTRRDWVGLSRLTDDDRGIVVAANHISWFDPLAIGFALWNADRPPRFLAKESVFRVPFIGRVLRSAGQIAVYRETVEAVSSIRDALGALDRGECVVVYPEGTITRDPGLWPMAGKTGAARIALASGRPLYPVAQWGPQEVMRPYVKELRLLPRKVMHIHVGEPVDLSDLQGRPLDTPTLQEATERVMSAITALEAGIRGEEPPAVRYVHRRRPVERPGGEAA